jgi:GT2 family glycosyltransferase
MDSVQRSLSFLQENVVRLAGRHVILRVVHEPRSKSDAPAEVVVVDGSPDEAVALALEGWTDARALPFDLLVVRSPAGLTRQRNVGIDVSRGEYVFYLDDDCLPLDGYFAALRRVLADDATGRIGAACGALVNEMGRPLEWRWRLRFALGIAPRGEPGTFFRTATSVPGSLGAPFHGTRPVDMLSGGASCYRRAVLRRHRFSLFFDGYAQGEDLEFSRRIAREWELRWCGDAHVVHAHAPGGRPRSRAKGMMEIRNRYLIWRRHVPDATLGDALRLWADFAFILAFDLATFVARPRERWRLAHAGGVALGALSCVFAPPRYEEPPAVPEYRLALPARLALTPAPT